MDLFDPEMGFWEVLPLWVRGNQGVTAIKVGLHTAMGSRTGASTPNIG